MVLDPYGKTYTFDVKQQIMGLQTRQVAEFMIKEYDLPLTWEEYAKQQSDNARALMVDSQLMPGTNL